MVDPKISKMEPQIRKKSWGGPRPNSGGRRPGSGRKKGTPNKVTAEIKELAQQYGPEAIAELARPATKAESEAARVAAIKELLDRGYGRAVQPIEGSVTHGVSEQLAELFKVNASGSLAARLRGVRCQHRRVSTSRNCTKSGWVWSLGAENEQQCQPPRRRREPRG